MAVKTSRPRRAAQPISGSSPASVPSQPNAPSAESLSAAGKAFLGREPVLRELELLLRDARLVTLTGPPGIGKSRLSVELARRVAAEHRDGACLVELAPIGDEDRLPDALAAALSISEEPGQSLADTLVARMQHRELLLVVDNCEHLLEASGRLIEMLLSRCAGVTIVATSREPLGIPLERVCKVQALSVPDPADAGADASPSDYEAVSLFVERARAVAPGFALNDHIAPAVAEICRRLDGIPLAIELAAALVSHLTPAEIAGRLDDRFNLLADGSSKLARHRTLAAAVDWSYELLSAPEQTLLRRASVFAGGFDLDAATAICARGDLDEEGIAERLDQLAAKSLLIADAPAGRYRLLETIRAYGAAQLERSGEVASLRESHAQYYVKLAAEAAPQLEGSAQARWLTRLDTEYADLRAALEWSLGHGRSTWAQELAASLAWFWRMRCHFSEGRRLLEAALSSGDGEATALTAKMLWGTGVMTMLTGDSDRATSLLDESASRYRELGDRSGEARALLMLASSTQGTPRAVVLAHESAELARESGDDWCVALALFVGGYEYLYSSEFANAQPEFEQCVEVARAAANTEGLRLGLLFLGQIALYQGDDERAQPLLEEALALSEELGDDYGRGTTLQYLGGLAMRRQEHEHARELLDGAIDLLRRTRPADLMISLVARSRVARIQGDHALARDLLGEALALAALHRDDATPALLEMGDHAAEEGDELSARRYLEEALEISRSRGIWLHVARALEGLGRLARDDGDPRRAMMLYREALRLNGECDNLPGAAVDLDALAGLAWVEGRPQQAARLFGAAHSVRRVRGAARAAAQAPEAETDLAQVRAALPVATFAAAWTAGTRMSVEAAEKELGSCANRHARACTGWESLTEAEHNVATLVAEGMTNKDVADRLHVTRDTVKTHLSHIYAKLDISGRGELARDRWRHQSETARGQARLGES